jgi:single-strand DNA-binding protein
MQDTNVAVFTGRLTRNPELEKTPNGKSICTLRVAISRRRGRDGEDRPPIYYDVETWGVLAETCAKHLAKGRQVSITGRLDHDEWRTNGRTRQRNYVVAEDVLFIGGAPKANGDVGNPEPEPAAPAAAEPEPAGAAA